MKHLIGLLVLLSCVIAADAQSPFPKIEITDRTTEPLLKAEKPWESFCIGYCRVIHVGPEYRLWYIAYDGSYRNDADYFLCYATSPDGIHWTRPNLGMYEYAGSKDNNIITKGNFGSGVFVDDHAPAAERFKCVFGQNYQDSWCMYGATSPDGLHWKRLAEPLLLKNTDTDNVCFFDETAGVYRFYIRMWTSADFRGRRIVGYLESKTFAGPLEPAKRKQILVPDEKDPADLHFYNSAAAKLREELYVMFPSGYTKGDDEVRPHLALSRDGVTFERPVRGPVLELGKTFDTRGLYVAAAPVPADKPGEFWFYYIGTNTKHDQQLPDKVKFDGGVGRFLVRIKD